MRRSMALFWCGVLDLGVCLHCFVHMFFDVAQVRRSLRTRVRESYRTRAHAPGVPVGAKDRRVVEEHQHCYTCAGLRCGAWAAQVEHAGSGVLHGGGTTFRDLKAPAPTGVPCPGHCACPILCGRHGEEDLPHAFSDRLIPCITLCVCYACMTLQACLPDFGSSHRGVECHGGGIPTHGYPEKHLPRWVSLGQTPHTWRRPSLKCKQGRASSTLTRRGVQVYQQSTLVENTSMTRRGPTHTPGAVCRYGAGGVCAVKESFAVSTTISDL